MLWLWFSGIIYREMVCFYDETVSFEAAFSCDTWQNKEVSYSLASVYLHCISILKHYNSLEVSATKDSMMHSDVQAP